MAVLAEASTGATPPKGRRRSAGGTGTFALALPLLLFFALFFLAPLVLLFVVSLFTDPKLTGMGIGQYAKFLTDGFNYRVLGQTLLLGGEVTLVCLVLGYPIAWLHGKLGRTGQGILILLTVLPLLTSVVVRTFAWIVILGRQGIVNSVLMDLAIIDTPLRLLYNHEAVIVAVAQVQMPLMVLPLVNALQRIDPNLSDASSVLGAGAWRTFFKVMLPLSLPGIVAGSLLTFAAAVTAFITQTLVGGGRLLYMPGYVYQQAMTLQNWPFAAAISIIFMLAVMLFVTLFNIAGRLSKGYVNA